MDFSFSAPVRRSRPVPALEQKLRISAREGDLETVQRLIDHFIDVTAQGGPSGNTALHEAVEAGQKAIVTTLLKAHGNFSGGSLVMRNDARQRPEDIADIQVQYWNGKCKTGEDREGKQKLFEEIRDELRGADVKTTEPSRRRFWKPQTPKHKNQDEQRRAKVCSKFTCFMQFYLPNRNPDYRRASIEELVYKFEPPAEDVDEAFGAYYWMDAREDLRDLCRKELKDGTLQDSSLASAWFHLPANNITWVNDLIMTLHNVGIIDGSFDANDIQRFITQTVSEVRVQADEKLNSKIDEKAKKNDIRTRRVALYGLSHPTDAQKEVYGVSIVMPFFDTENGSKDEDSKNMDSLQETYDASEIYVRRTLDQSFHASLSQGESDELAKQQVVWRHTAKSEEQKFIVVKQLWIWKFGGVVITALSGTAFRSHLISYISNCSGADDLITQILRLCSECDRPPYQSRLSEEIYSIFEQSIAAQDKVSIKLYEDFAELINRDGDKGESSEAFGISKDMDCMKEIMDIKNELVMIERVLSDQASILEAWTEFKGSKQQLRDKTSTLVEIANGVYERLQHLLDMKQEHATLRLAQSSERRQKEGETESKLLFVFTAVTVIFTPISFVATLFAIPSAEFPHTDSDVSWTLAQIAIAFIVSLVIVVTIIILWLLYSGIENKKRQKRNLNTHTDSNETQAGSSASPGEMKPSQWPGQAGESLTQRRRQGRQKQGKSQAVTGRDLGKQVRDTVTAN
ncbi:hypothetical protein HD806DRAFT_352247 [Xylariaceae sp. AK1471]|nr:hypothetical protein HD806DRAFT_352247 [Xylariaceae sp. AK1471]